MSEIRIHPATRRRPRRARAGLTLIEIILVSTILLVAINVFSSTVVATGRQRAINKENAHAMEAARSVLETMRNARFSDLYALYNSDGSDDPMGPNTAPGGTFAVSDLNPLEDGVLQGEVVLPIETTGVDGAVSYLSEQFNDPSLGMPRDLNGDGEIDALPHDDDYIMLPVLVRVRWRGLGGEREMRVYSTLVEYDW